MQHFLGSLKYNIPSGTYFSNNHVWVRKNSYGLIKIGIDEILSEVPGIFSIGGCAKVGTYLSKNDLLCEINSGERKVRIALPVSGTIKFYNSFSCEKRVTEPYDDDWIALIQSSSFIDEKNYLMTEEEYNSWLNSKLNRLYN